MSIKVDPAKIDELSLKLKGLGDGIEDGERRVHQNLYRFLQDLRGRYDEEREVQRALDAVEDSLREVTDSARILTSSLHQKAKGLTQASQAYLDSEETVKKTMQQYFALPSSYYGKTGALTGDDATKYLKDPLFEDPVVQKLHQQALHGTEEEKQEAKQKLDTIFKARYDIGRAQVAYSVYKAFNNKPLMEGAHKEAERLRKVLKDLGIDEKYYGKEVKLSHLFSGAPIQACSYDPSFSITKDGKFIPMEMPKDNQYIYLLGLMMKGGKEGAWAKSLLGEIHKLLTEIGRSQTAWHEYKAKNMQKEMDGAHAYAEKLRTALKTKYSLSSEMVDDVDYREMWMGAGPAGKYLLSEMLSESGKKTTNFNDIVTIGQQIVFGNEGDYSTVTRDDGKNMAKGYPGGLSVGRLQWHENRAYDLLLKIVRLDTEAAKSILGSESNIYKDLNNPHMAKNPNRWKARVLSVEEAKAISNLISTDVGKKIQDEQARSDMQSYISAGTKLGIHDQKAIIYFADLYNQSPKGATRVVKLVKASGKELTLENIHRASLSDEVMGKYKTRREITYKKTQKIEGGPSQTTTPNTSDKVSEPENIKIAKFLSVAEEELSKGFKEYKPKGAKEGDNNNPYGKWFGLNGQPWCAIFVSFCANEAGILGTVVPKYSNVEEGRKWYVKKGRFKGVSSGYAPKAGDVIFFRNGNQNHTGIITAYDPKTKEIITIEGNSSDSIARRSYNLNKKNHIVGYGVNGGSDFGIIPNDATSGVNTRTR